MIKIFTFMAAFGVIAAAAPASAANYELGTLSSMSVNIKTVAPGALDDNYSFTLGAGELAVDAANLRFEFPSFGVFYNITGLTGSLFTASGTQIGASFTEPTGFTGLASGDYRINLSGNADGSLGGIYTLALLPQAAAPIPGPGAYLVSGLGVLALGMRYRSRRKRSAQLTLAMV